jgi:hypothetical protein
VFSSQGAKSIPISQRDACKDPVDVSRYATLVGLDYIGEDA